MKALLYLGFFIIVFLIGVRYIERHNIYFPEKEIIASPKAVGLVYEEIYFKTSDNKQLNGWFVPNNQGEIYPVRERSSLTGFTLIFCHGNAGNISHRIDKILLLHRLGLNLFIFDYRGYGKSLGVPCEAGLYKDAAAAHSYLIKQRGVSQDDIIVYGESIGGVVAVDLAHRVKLRALITEEAFTSVKDMGKIVYPFLPKFIFSNRFNCISKIREVECPKLIIHSIDDEIVPFHLGERLFNAAQPPKKFLKIRGSHNTAFLDSKQQFTEGISSFLYDL